MTKSAAPVQFASKNWESVGPRDIGYRDALVSDADEFSMLDASKPAIDVNVVQLTNANSKIVHVKSSGHRISLVDSDHLSIMIPTRGTLIMESRDNRQSIRASGSVRVQPSERVTEVRPDASGQFESFMIKLPVAHAFGGNLGDKFADRGAERFPIESLENTNEALVDLLRYIVSDLNSSAPMLVRPKAWHAVETLFWEHYRAFGEEPNPDEPSINPTVARLVGEAIDFMHANYGEALTVDAIAAQVRTHPRSLHAAFKKVFNQGPWASLSAIRLEKAHIRLQTASSAETVTSIAFDCGFAHLGRFSKFYKSSYGVAPSETLKQRR